MSVPASPALFFFFFNDTATTEIYTLSLHDALPIYPGEARGPRGERGDQPLGAVQEDRKSTRLNSSHTIISYAVFCLKKKKKHEERDGEIGLMSSVDGGGAWLARRCHVCVLCGCGRELPTQLVRLFLIFFFLNNRAPPEFNPFPLPAPFPT